MATHPTFEDYKHLLKTGQSVAALRVFLKLLEDMPPSVALHWYVAIALEMFDRQHLAILASNHWQTLPSDGFSAPSKWIQTTDMNLAGDRPASVDPKALGAAEDDSERSQALLRRQRLAGEAAQWNEQELRAALAEKPDNVQALFCLSERLRAPTNEPDGGRVEEAQSLLDQVIRLAPEELDYRRVRARYLRRDALGALDTVVEGSALGVKEPGMVNTLTGICYHGEMLEAAAEDYHLCWQKEGCREDALALASILHLLGKFDEALQTYDQLLVTVVPDSPLQSWILEQRHRSENQGTGEREQVAAHLSSLCRNRSGKDQTLEESQATTALLAVADAIRQGASMSEAFSANMSDDPDTDRAMHIARSILSLTRQPPPGLVAVDPARYPGVQRRHCDRIARAAKDLGLTKIADAEAMGLFPSLGRHVLIRMFANGEGDIGLASFAFLPKWLGLGAFLRLYLKGKWKPVRMTECVTQFEDGTHISTQPESISPFEYGGKIMVNKLPADASVATIYQTHGAAVAKFRAAHPSVRPMLVHTIEAAEARWIAGDDAKTAYRQSIGYITERELRRLLGQHYDALADKVMTQLHRMAGKP